MSNLIDRQAAINAIRTAKDKSEAHRMLVQMPSAQPECEDAVPRTSVEYICRKNTVSTNPYEHKYHDKFIQFMDDPEISDFGRWQHSNGFNTALVAVECDLDKVPSVTPKQPGWIPCNERLPGKDESFYVLCCDKYGEIMIGNVFECYDGETPYSAESENEYMYDCVAWMPLPTPYREGRQDGKN